MKTRLHLGTGRELRQKDAKREVVASGQGGEGEGEGGFEMLIAFSAAHRAQSLATFWSQPPSVTSPAGLLLALSNGDAWRCGRPAPQAEQLWHVRPSSGNFVARISLLGTEHTCARISRPPLDPTTRIAGHRKGMPCGCDASKDEVEKVDLDRSGTH